MLKDIQLEFYFDNFIELGHDCALPLTFHAEFSPIGVAINYQNLIMTMFSLNFYAKSFLQGTHVCYAHCD